MMSGFTDQFRMMMGWWSVGTAAVAVSGSLSIAGVCTTPAPEVASQSNNKLSIEGVRDESARLNIHGIHAFSLNMTNSCETARIALPQSVNSSSLKPTDSESQLPSLLSVQDTKKIEIDTDAHADTLSVESTEQNKLSLNNQVPGSSSISVGRTSTLPGDN